MPIISQGGADGLRFSDWLLASLTEGMHYSEEGLELESENLWPNYAGPETAPDGEPEGWDLSGLPERIVANHIRVSPVSPEPGKPTPQPDARMLTQQTTAPVPVEQPSWTAEYPIEWGPQPASSERSLHIKPDPPKVEAVPAAVRGFDPGNYLWAYAVADKFGLPTTPTSWTAFSLQAGQIPVFPVPESFSSGAFYWVIYMTLPGGGPETAGALRFVPINEIAGRDSVPVMGPWQSRGKPSASNLAGVPVLPRPREGGKKPDFWEVSSPHDLREGRYRFMAILANDRGPGLPSAPSKAYVVRGEMVRKMVDPGSGGTGNVSANATTNASGLPVRDDFSHDAEGKREPSESPYVDAGGSYLGEEVDFEESRFIALVNEARRAKGLPVLVNDRNLTRMAYRDVRGPKDTPEPEYEGRVIRGRSHTIEDDAREALSEVYEDKYLSEDMRAVGVAREPIRRQTGVSPEVSRFAWRVVFGTASPEKSQNAEICETIDPDGTTHRHGHTDDGGHVYVESVSPAGEVFFADATNSPPQGWDCVVGRSCNYRYSGSFSSAISHGGGQWDGAISVKSTGGQLNISDGDLPDNVMGRTYSDGRMYFDSAIMGGATENARRSCASHEFGHALGFPHRSDPSVMNTPIYSKQSTNYQNLTQNDKDLYAETWGDAQTEPTDPGTEEPGGGGTQEPGGEEYRPPRYEWVNSGYKKNHGIRLRIPDAVKQAIPQGGHVSQLKYTYYVIHTPLSGAGQPTYYRVYPSEGRRGTSQFFGYNRRSVQRASRRKERRGASQPDQHGPVVQGYTPEEEPAGLRVRLVQEDPPTEDMSLLEGPSPDTKPDAPQIGGNARPPAGKYYAAVQGVTESGSLTGVSEHSEKSITNAEMLKVSPVSTVNVLPGATFSQIDGQGNPEGWTFAGVASNQPGSRSVSEGVLSLSVSQSTNLAPSALSQAMSVPLSGVMTLAGDVTAENVINGRARVVARQYDAAGGEMTGVRAVLAELPVGGAVSFTKRLARLDSEWSTLESIALDPACASVRLSLELWNTTANNSIVQLTAKFSKLRVLPFPFDVAPVMLAAPGSPANFDPPASASVPGHSFAAFGVPATTQGAESVEPEPPLSVVDFEDGQFPSLWTHTNTTPQNATASSQIIDDGFRASSLYDPLFGSYSWRIHDGTLAGHSAYLSKSFAEEELPDASSLAVRTLMRVITVPLGGQFVFLSVVGDGGMGANLALRSDGMLLVYVDRPGQVPLAGPIASGITAGQVLDAELSVSGGGTQNGGVSVGLGLNGAPRKIIWQTGGVDAGANEFRYVSAGVSFGNLPAAAWEFVLDQIVVTKRGDVLNRERPEAPPDYTPAPPDRPTLNGVPRELTPPVPSEEPDEEMVPAKIGQLVVFLKPGDAPPERPVVMPLLERPLSVKPGESYTMGLFSWWVNLGVASPGVRVYLEGVNVEPYLAASLGEMAGARDWREVDDFLSFTVPEPTFDAYGRVETAYTEARVEMVLHDGLYVFQEPLFTRGVYTDFAARDARRSFARATAAEGVFHLDARPEAWELGLPGVGAFVSEVGVNVEDSDDLPEGISVEAHYSETQDRFSYTPESADREELRLQAIGRKSKRTFRTRVRLTGDGQRSAKIPPGGVYLRTWHPVSVLTREDGTHFPGAIFSGNLVSASWYPDYETGNPGGHHQSIRKSGVIGRIRDLDLHAFTEDAKRALEAVCLSDELRLEVPTSGGEKAGEVFVVRIRSQVEMEAKDIPPRIARFTGTGYRGMYFTATVDEAEVIEHGSLPAPFASAVDLSEKGVPYPVGNVMETEFVS